LNRLNISELVGLFINEEKHVQHALDQSRKSLEKAIRILESAFRKGGRLFYVGAGTSGRLGILDASEIPPTFGESADRVQAIIAGGPAAITNSVEAAEDDSSQGAAAIVERGVKRSDVVCGITASGRTPFVVSALQRAKTLGARTILITCNPKTICSCDVKIELFTGPELIAGSTRLKCGTATKITLNILTTCTMIRLGKVYGNQMADLKVTNFKLKDRAIRLVSQIKGWPAHKAEVQLEQNNWNIRAVLDS
jgi:N-acetylmuramic acid 6-phosphate etherase